MSYNGVGLASVRGTGTSGYVQRNLSLAKVQAMRRHQFEREHAMAAASAPERRRPNSEILAHHAKREVELKVAELRAAMEEQGYPEAEVLAKEEEVRAALLAAAAAAGPGGSGAAAGGAGGSDSHAVAARKEAADARVRDAFGIGSGYVEGAAFDREAQEAKREAARAARAAREAEEAKREAERAARRTAAEEEQRRQQQQQQRRRREE
jgi:serine/arginine repetitive matrix protein 2